MRQRQLELALKKQRLLLDCASQRLQLAEHAAGVQPLFAGADGAIGAVRWMKQHPVSVAAASAAVFVLRPRLIWRLGMRGMALWKVVQTLRGRR
jgi:hypothetical protein